jgi:hypothetical protein
MCLVKTNVVEEDKEVRNSINESVLCKSRPAKVKRVLMVIWLLTKRCTIYRFLS